MRRFVPRAFLGAALAVSAAACAAGTATSGDSASGDAGGRYQVLIPDPSALGGVSPGDAERVGNLLRRQVSELPTHTAVDAGAMRGAMRQYDVAALDSVSSRQLAQQMNAENVLYVMLSPGGAGLAADVQFVDVASGDVIRLEDVSGSNATELATAVFASLQSSIEGIRQAAACNDYLSSAQYDRALTTCEAALAVVPSSSAALYGKATALLQLERFEESLESYQALLERDNASQDALLGAGLAASRLERTDDALQYYNRYLQLNPGNVQVRQHVASQIANTGDVVAAYQVLLPAAEAEENRTNPEFQRYLFSLATAAGQRVGNQDGDAAARPYFEAALQAYQRAFATDSIQPDVSQIRQAIAVNIGLGNTSEALNLARAATVQYDTVASVWYQYGSALSEADQHAEAAQAFGRVIQLDPDFENVYIRRGMALLEAGQRQQALADLQQAAQRGNQADVARVVFAEGNRALQAQRFEEAERLLDIAAGYATGELRGQIVFLQGYAIFQQGVAIARANSTGAVAPARRALELFQRAQPLLQQGTNAQKQQIMQGLQQYIENVEAIIRAGSR